MNSTSKTALIFAVVIAAVLLFGSGTMTGGRMGGGMMGNGTMGGYGWMWVPTLLIICLGVLLIWVISGRKK
ncbi:MAG: hypothetical protein SGJ01_16890 [Gemmatimonadota bacterium]|nr:hypothetical protein [Gemmatimonadota bacterium]